MKILGISGSPRKKDRSGAYKLVQTVLENTGCDYDFILLKRKLMSLAHQIIILLLTQQLMPFLNVGFSSGIRRETPYGGSWVLL